MMSPQDVMPGGNQRNIAPAITHKIATYVFITKTRSKVIFIYNSSLLT